MYQALYRKWRPVSFDAVVGQEQVTRVLRYQVANDKLSHAYLFIGSRGTGKTTCARILSRAVNCDNPENGNPCGKCPSCKAILEGFAPEIVEIDAASNNGVDDVRALRDEAVYSPATLKKRVYIIDEVHMLSKSAFNALLKILEEPPSHLLFILATTELNKVPPTILSRCQRFNFRRIDQTDIASYLIQVAEKENLKLSTDAAKLLARLAEGGMRDALSLLDQCSFSGDITEEYILDTLGLAQKSVTADLLGYILSSDTANSIMLFQNQWVNGKDPVTVLRELDALLRDILLINTCGRSAETLISGYYSIDSLKQMSLKCSTAKIIGMMELIQKHIADMRDSANPKLTAELCLISLSTDSGDEIHILRDRVDKLEAGIVTVRPVHEPEWGGRSYPDSFEVSVSKNDKTVADLNTVSPNVEISCNGISKPVSEECIVESDEADNARKQVSVPESAGSIVIHSEENELSEECVESTDYFNEEEKQAADSNDVVQSEPVWEKLIPDISTVVTPDMKSSLSDPNSMYGILEDNILKLSIHSGFLYNRFVSSPNIQNISAVLSKRLGRDIRVVVSEMIPEKRETRNIDELRSFSNVHFND